MVKTTVAGGLVVLTVRAPKLMNWGDKVTADTAGGAMVMVAVAVLPIPTTLVPLNV